MPRPNKPRWRKEQGAWVSKINGSLKTLAKGYNNRAEANRVLKKLLEEAQRPPEEEPTLRMVCETFLKFVERERSPLTLELYVRNLSSFCEHARHDTLASHVMPKHVTAWLNAHQWGPTTRNVAITVVKRAFNWAKKQGHIKASGIADMEKPAPRPRASIMSAEQSRKVFEAIGDEPFRDFLTALEQTGMRPSEAMSLTAEMIDFEEGVIKAVGKGRPRAIYLNGTASALLVKLAERWPEGPILRNTRGKPWTRHATKNRFLRLREKLGLGPEATSESYRHVFATDGLENGVEIATMAELMGHKSTKMISQNYSKLGERKDHLKEAVRKVRPDKAT